MNKKLNKKLYDDFPKIFQHNRAAPFDPMQPMAFGFECGDGWYSIINHCCGMIQNDVNLYGRKQVVAVQVKEKLGGLRFYVDEANEKTYDIIDFFESLSYIICEKCGNSNGTTKNTNGWITTRCVACRKAKKK